MTIPKSQKTLGFTLIELLVVMSIISLLSSIVMSSLNSARAKARNSQRIQSLMQLRTALEMYYSANGVYPNITTGEWNLNATGAPDYTKWNTWSHQVLYDALVPTYIKSLPIDPQSKTNQTCTNYLSDPSGCIASLYVSNSTGSCYILGVNLETSNPHSGSWCGGNQIANGGCKCSDIWSGSPSNKD